MERSDWIKSFNEILKEYKRVIEENEQLKQALILAKKYMSKGNKALFEMNDNLLEKTNNGS